MNEAAAETSSFAIFGAFALGAVIGWYLYFLNRHRTDEVKITDLAGVIGVLGGATITGLFGEGSSAVFGGYGVGLAVGFFGYFVVLLYLVKHSDGAFTLNWFLDGRRRDPSDEESAPGGDRPNRAMTLRTSNQHRSRAGLKQRDVGDRVDAIRDAAIDALSSAILTLLQAAERELDDGRRRALQARARVLDEQRLQLNIVKVKAIIDDDRVAAAIAALSGETRKIESAASEMKERGEELKRAADLIALVTGLIGGLKSLA
jgi:hypothetical protein